MATSSAGDVAGNGEHGDSGGVEGALDRLLEQAGQLPGLVTVRQNTDTSRNTASLSTSWKKSEPSSASGTWPQIASTGACDFLAS